MPADGADRIATIQHAAETGVAIEVREGEEPPRGADVLHRANHRELKLSIFNTVASSETLVAKEGTTCFSEWLPVRACGWPSDPDCLMLVGQEVHASHIPFADWRAYNLPPHRNGT